MAGINDEDIPFHVGDEDDSCHWLPINTTEQDGQGMFFPDMTPSNSPPCTPLPSTSQPPPEQHNPWANIFQEHANLLSNKESMDRRKFNKSVLLLLNKTIALAQSSIATAQPTAANIAKPIALWQNPKIVFSAFRDILLNEKEVKSEELVERVVAFVNQSVSPLLTADERKEELHKKSVALLQDISPQMSIKLTPIVKSYISRMFGSDLDDMLAEVSLPEMSLKDKTNLYTRMIDNFLDNVGCISFAYSNKRLLGNISPVDLWFLTFFAFVTARRCRGDNLLMLGCVGE